MFNKVLFEHYCIKCLYIFKRAMAYQKNKIINQSILMEQYYCYDIIVLWNGYFKQTQILRFGCFF